MDTVNKGLSVASTAMERMERAVANGSAVHVLFRNCPYITCESMEAAKRSVGKNRQGLYTIVPMLSK